MAKEAPQLLSDEQMRQFITQGFLILKTDFPQAFHQDLTKQLNEVYENEGNPGNNLLPRIHELQKVFDHPIVDGALTSVLGENYLMHSHRHGHFNAVNTPGGWHKDSYWGYKRMRNHHPWWAMIMYFPQDTPIELGPTGVFPGTQNYESRVFDKDEVGSEALASGEAGTFALIHYDIWHRSTPNLLGKPRYMLKFEFMRTEAPTEPTWNCKALDWQPPETLNTPIAEHDTLWRETWNWLCGQVGSLADACVEDTSSIATLVRQLSDPFEPTALNAAYDLACHGPAGADALLGALQSDDTSVSRVAAYGLTAAGCNGVEGLTRALDSDGEEIVIHAAFALGELGALANGAVNKLVGLLDGGSDRVRVAIAESLGMIGTPVDAVVAGLVRCLKDENAQVRFTAGLALTRLGEAAELAILHLEAALDDENRYVRGHALEALRYIGTDQAKDILIKALMNARWCTITTPASAFYP